jgi:predicted RNA-binding Zn ribbon-like protein
MASQMGEFTFVAGRLCLDFVNTEVGQGGRGSDPLASFPNLVRWARAAAALDPAEAEFVLERWTDGAEVEDALAAARALRRQLRAVAQQLVAGDLRVLPESLELTNQALRSRPGYLQLERSGGEWAARWKVPLRRPDDVLWRIARSAAALFTDDDPALVRRCARESCGLFFYDTTKNHRKRFCRMEVCGAAARAAAYYHRRTGR